jgi:hypothetical protein
MDRIFEVSTENSCTSETLGIENINKFRNGDEPFIIGFSCYLIYFHKSKQCKIAQRNPQTNLVISNPMLFINEYEDINKIHKIINEAGKLLY